MFEEHRADFSSPQVLYVGNFCFPNGDAGGLRVQRIGKALREAGYQVAFAGSETGREEDRQPDGGFRYQGFAYVPEKNQRTARWKFIDYHPQVILQNLMGTTTMRRLRAMDLSATGAIIAYHGSSLLLYRLQSFCRKRRIALLTDCTEWYDPWHLPGGPLGPICWDSEIRMRWMQPRIGRVIAISSFLEQDCRRRGCAVLRVPPLVDMEELAHHAAQPPRPEDGVLRLVYSGSPAKKDLLGNAIRGLHQVRAGGAAVELHVVGAKSHVVAACLAKDARLLDELGNAVVCHGRVAQPEAMNLVAQADFSILLRPNKRYAHAGFPTKLAESLSLGVPILTNLTSNIGEYVRDGREGIVLNDCSPEAFAAAVHRVLEMPHSQWLAMRHNARQRAEECFDYRRYVAPLKKFLEEAQVSRERCQHMQNKAENPQ